MHSPGFRRSRLARRRRLAAVALPLALTLACTTVRAPASAIAPVVRVEDGVAAPQLELWIESSRGIDPAALARASEEARQALRAAVAERQAPGGDALLVVRAQAVSRTDSRRADQRAAVAGVVVGAVVVAVVTVVMLASGKGGGGAPRASGAGRAPRAGIRPPRAAPVLPAVRPHLVRIAAPRPALPHVSLYAVAHVGGAPPPVEVEPPPLAPPPPEAAGPSAAAPEEVAVVLPPPAPLEVERRGFFAGDLLRLELLVVDPRTGSIRAAKTVTGDVDVRDGAAVRALLASALDDAAGWEHPSAPVSAPAAAPPAAPGSR